jgi:hypothetical protein
MRACVSVCIWEFARAGIQIIFAYFPRTITYKNGLVYVAKHNMCVRTNAQIHKNTYIHTCMHACLLACISRHTHVIAGLPTSKQASIHTYIHVHKYMHTAYIHAFYFVQEVNTLYGIISHACIHTKIRACIQTCNIYTYLFLLSES